MKDIVTVWKISSSIFQDDQNGVLVSKTREYPCTIQDRKPTMEI